LNKICTKADISLMPSGKRPTTKDDEEEDWGRASALAGFPREFMAECRTTETGTGAANCLEGPSEDYGNDEHTTVAAFLPWRGS
jgi:hypothetical protein